MEHVLVAEMAANVWKLEVSVGQRVKQGQDLLVLESMKMEIPVEAPVDGEVTRIAVAAGYVVAEGQQLVVVTEQGA